MKYRNQMIARYPSFLEKIKKIWWHRFSHNNHDDDQISEQISDQTNFKTFDHKAVHCVWEEHIPTAFSPFKAQQANCLCVFLRLPYCPLGVFTVCFLCFPVFCIQQCSSAVCSCLSWAPSHRHCTINWWMLARAPAGPLLGGHTNTWLKYTMGRENTSIEHKIRFLFIQKDKKFSEKIVFPCWLASV